MTDSQDVASDGDNGKAKARAALEAALLEVNAGERETSELLTSMGPTVIDPMVEAVGEQAASVTSVREALEKLRVELEKLWHGIRTAIQAELRALDGGTVS